MSGEGDTLLALQGLIGAVGMAAFTYFIPYLLQAELSPTPLSPRRVWWGRANVAVGGALMLVPLLEMIVELATLGIGTLYLIVSESIEELILNAVAVSEQREPRTAPRVSACPGGS